MWGLRSLRLIAIREPPDVHTESAAVHAVLNGLLAIEKDEVRPAYFDDTALTKVREL